VHIDEDRATKIAAKRKYVNDELKKLFYHLDTDGNGFINKSEFGVLTENLGGCKTPAGHDAFKSLDSDGSGEVDEGEFLNFFGKFFHGGYYNMSVVEVDSYFEFMQACATMQTGFVPEEAVESYTRDIAKQVNPKRGCKMGNGCSLM